ncbi:MAG: phytase [Gammaproteobacteria bacterium]
MRATLLLIHCITAPFLSMAVSAGEVPVIAAVTATDPLHAYDDAPVTPDADDPAIWVHPTDRSKSLIIAAIKDAGLIVYNLDGDVVQAIPPPNLPTILPEDPPTPAGVNLDATDPCPESEAGDTSGATTTWMWPTAFGSAMARSRRASMWRSSPTAAVTDCVSMPSTLAIRPAR